MSTQTVPSDLLQRKRAVREEGLALFVAGIQDLPFVVTGLVGTARDSIREEDKMRNISPKGSWRHLTAGVVRFILLVFLLSAGLAFAEPGNRA